MKQKLQHIHTEMQSMEQRTPLLILNSLTVNHSSNSLAVVLFTTVPYLQLNSNNLQF